MIPALAEIERILLREWDPIGVQHAPGAVDEYDGYAFRIFLMLKSKASEADVARYLDWAQSENMGLSPTADRNHAIAAKIMDAVEKFEKESPKSPRSGPAAD
jgi:hypothetical protein